MVDDSVRARPAAFGRRTGRPGEPNAASVGPAPAPRGQGPWDGRRHDDLASARQPSPPGNGDRGTGRAGHHRDDALASNFRVHSYEPRRLSRAPIFNAGGVRRCRYEAVINLEQGSLAGTAFLRALGIPIRIGLLPLHDSSKAPFLTMPLRLREHDSMWTSFVRATRLIDPGFPEAPDVRPPPIGGSPPVCSDVSRRNSRPPTVRAAFHLGSGQGQPFRRWPVDQFAQLAERMPPSPGPGNRPDRDRTEKPVVGAFQALRRPGADGTALGSLERTAAVIAECDLLVDQRHRPHASRRRNGRADARHLRTRRSPAATLRSGHVRLPSWPAASPAAHASMSIGLRPPGPAPIPTISAVSATSRSRRSSRRQGASWPPPGSTARSAHRPLGEPADRGAGDGPATAGG